MEIHEIRWRSSEKEKKDASLEPSKGFYKGSRLSLKAASIHTPKSWKSSKSNEILENPWKSIENDESPQMTRSQPGIEQRFL